MTLPTPSSPSDSESPAPSVRAAVWSVAIWAAPLVPVAMMAVLWWLPEHVFALSASTLVGLALIDAVWPRSASVVPPRPRNRSLVSMLLPRVNGVLLLAMLALALLVGSQLSWGSAWGLGAAMGLIMGLHGVAVGHQLGHSPRRRDKALAWALLSLSACPQFMVEHYRGHHPRAATWDDATSAREGESLWQYLIRALPQAFGNAVRLERLWLVQRHKPTHQSKLLRATAVMLLVLVASCVLFGLRAGLMLLVQGGVAVLMVESVNYIEHYGLVRKDEPGHRVPFAAEHGWNANRPMAHVLLLGRPRHSDHHLQPWKRATELQAVEAPELPLGYLASVLLAWIPPLWFAHTQPLLDLLHRRLREGPTTTSSLSGSA